MYTVNTQLFYGYEKGETDAAIDLMKMISENHALMQVESSSDIKYRLCEADGKYLLFAFNYTKEELKDNPKILLDGKTIVLDVRVKEEDVSIYEVEKC